jgi:membrane-associated protein
MAKMDYKKFITFNFAGGFLWGLTMTLAGYYLGQVIPDVDKYLLPIVLGIIILSVLPGVWHMREEIKGFARKHPLMAKLLKFKEDWLG